MEAVLKQMPGVLDVTSGYMGGTVAHPTYEQVCRADTGHAEIVQVTFDCKKISYQEVLELFWKLHDPTTPNRQGNDVGTQYRSIICYHDERQHDISLVSKVQVAEKFPNPIVTEIVPLEAFYPAERYHQNYYSQNRNAGYCRVVITPKLSKLGMAL